MRTLLTIKQQEQWIISNGANYRLQHKWSCRGMGNSKIINNAGTVIGAASGCGYDRYGSALGEAVITMFPEEVHTLAKRHCKGRRRTYKQAPNLYGLFYNAVKDKAWVDGACGSSCMTKILNAIGFTLEYAGETDNQANSGSSFYLLKPITKHERKYL